ncbi:hypothetical protein JS85_03175 [Vibrio vulnificus]|nr:hypothetical protein JS85_03175 [Vibrio vulnificus]
MISLSALLKSFQKCGDKFTGLHAVSTWRSEEENLQHPNDEAISTNERHTQDWKEDDGNEEERFPLQ